MLGSRGRPISNLEDLCKVMDTGREAKEPPDDAQHHAGESINGWRLEKYIGSGGMGEVWLASGKGPDLKVLKVLKKRSGFEGWFMHEVKINDLLKHPNIVEVFDHHPGNEETPAYFIIDNMELGSLKDAFRHIWREKLHYTDTLLREIYGHVFQGLEYMHGKGYVHLDMKESNILLDQSEGSCIPKVADFTLALPPDKILAESKLAGTIKYFPPERLIRGGDREELEKIWSVAPRFRPDDPEAMPIDQRCDVFAVGVMLHRAYTMREVRTLAIYRNTQYQNASIEVQHVRKAKNVVLTERRYDHPFRQAILGATRLDPRHRLPTMAAIAARLK